MGHVYLFPVVGLVIGGLIAAAACLAGYLLPQALVAVVVIIATYRVCGINHIDGLADFGDGVMAHGSAEKKVQAMKDVSLGTGGAVFIAVLILATFAILSSIPSPLLPLAIVGAEVSAKQSMVSFAAFSRSLQKGFGQIMIERTSLGQFAAGLAISSLLSTALLGPLGLAMLAVSQATSIYIVLVARRNFGGGTGDCIGATNEICRAMALASALSLGGVLSWTPW